MASKDPRMLPGWKPGPNQPPRLSISLCSRTDTGLGDPKSLGEETESRTCIQAQMRGSLLSGERFSLTALGDLDPISGLSGSTRSDHCRVSLFLPQPDCSTRDFHTGVRVLRKILHLLQQTCCYFGGRGGCVM